MAIFYDQRGIEEKLSELRTAIAKRFREVAKIDAEEIAESLIDELGLDTVCSDIDNTIQYAEDEGWISESADTNITYDYDNELLYVFTPYPEKEEVDMHQVDDYVDAGGFEAGFTDFAYQMWCNAIKNELRKVLEKICNK